MKELSVVTFLLFIIAIIGIIIYLIYKIISLYKKDMIDKDNSAKEMIQDLYLRKNKVIDFIWKSIK
jgi:hypothetical protein